MIRLNRYQASLIHLVISAIVVGSVIALAVTLWYPYPFGRLFEVWEALKLVAFVDVVLGPLLTLALFKPGKKGLVSDLIVVALLQISALSYGIYTTHQNRPAYLVYNDALISCVTADTASSLGMDLSDKASGQWRIPMLAFDMDYADEVEIYEKRLLNVYEDSEKLEAFDEKNMDDLIYRALLPKQATTEYRLHSETWDERLGSGWQDKPYSFMYLSCANTRDLAAIDTQSYRLVDVVPITNVYNTVRKPNQRILDKIQRKLELEQQNATPDSSAKSSEPAPVE